MEQLVTAREFPFLTCVVFAHSLFGKVRDLNRIHAKATVRKEPQNDSYLSEGLDGAGVKHS
jgi:hypothetical protein